MSVAAALYKQLENREAQRLRMKVQDVRATLARRVKAAPGTLRNLVNGRLKRAEYLENAIREALIKSLEAELVQITHQIEVLRQCGARPDSSEMLEAETLLARVRTIIERGK